MGLGKRTITLFISLLFLLLPAGPPVWAAEPRAVEIEARLVEFDPEAKVYKATGGVLLTSDDFQLQADTVVYYSETALVTAEHGVKLQTAAGSWEGESLVYSFRDEKGKFSGITGKEGNYYISGKTGEIRGEEILLTEAAFTPCELATPCLKIKAGQVRVVDGKVQVKRGWLYLKNLPVLPLPPVTVATDQFEDWPRVEIGANSTRGLYVTGELTQELTEEATLRYGGGVGTRQWWNAQAGLRWHLASGLVFDSGLTWEEYLRGKASMTYNLSPLRVTVAVNRNWTELMSGENSWTVQGPLSKKSTWQLLYTSSFNEKANGVNQRQDYGLGFSGRWLPGFTLGTGLYYGAGDLKEKSLNGWYLRTTWSGGIDLARTWRIETAGETWWQTGSEPLWVQHTVKLVKELHCFKADLGYNVLEKNISFNLGFNW